MILEKLPRQMSGVLKKPNSALTSNFPRLTFVHYHVGALAKPRTAVPVILLRHEFFWVEQAQPLAVLSAEPHWKVSLQFFPDLPPPTV
jgi:hypothetical protein